MEPITSLLIGISSSLVATFIFIGLSYLIKEYLLPWYADTIYLGVRIDGKWQSTEIRLQEELVSTDKNPFTLNLIQNGENITGEYSHKDSKTNKTQAYALHGKIKDMYFLATAVPKSKREIDGICFLLHLSNKNSNLVMTGSILAQGESGTILNFQELTFIWENS